MNNLEKRKGFIIFDREFLTKNPCEGYLKEVFNNFFPVATKIVHEFSLYEKIKMFGFSRHFREVKEGEAIPQYDIYITANEGNYYFHQIIERK